MTQFDPNHTVGGIKIRPLTYDRAVAMLEELKQQ